MTQSTSRDHAATSIAGRMAESSVDFGTSGARELLSAMTEALNTGWRPMTGYEANGGFLLASDVEHDGRRLAALPTRDAVLPMLCALVAAGRAGVALSSPVAALPRRYALSDRRRDTPTVVSGALLASLVRPDQEMALALFGTECGFIAHIDLIDGVRMVFSSEDIVRLRASGNAPELRVYVEAGCPGRAGELLQLGMAVATGWKDGQACAP